MLSFKYQCFIRYRTNKRQSFSGSLITVGLVSSLDLYLDIENAGEDAFQAVLSFILPTNVLELVNIFNQTRRGEVCCDLGYSTDIDSPKHTIIPFLPFLILCLFDTVLYR